MRVSLPEDLCQAVKERGLSVSELLHKAIADELRRQRLNEQADEYLAALEAKVGEPNVRERSRADAVARRISDHAAIDRRA